MTVEKTHSPFPFFVLVFLFLSGALLNQGFPSLFFPALGPALVWTFSVALGTAFGFTAVRRMWTIHGQRRRALELVLKGLAERKVPAEPDENDIINAGRYIARLVRNTDEDLREINPDFSTASLKRLAHYLPDLLDEIGGEADAKIRLGVVGTYLGETLCRCSGWEWFYRADPALRQFEYLGSIIRKEGHALDPYDWAGALFAGQKKIGDLLKEAAPRPVR